MTIAEYIRLVNSKNRRIKQEARDKATYDYILADLIGRSVSRIYSSSNTMPNIEKVYPSIFNEEDVEEQKKKRAIELSALRFKQFANFHNKRFKGGSKE